MNLAILFAIHAVFREVRSVRGFGTAFEAPVLASVEPWASRVVRGGSRRGLLVQARDAEGARRLFGLLHAAGMLA